MSKKIEPYCDKPKHMKCLDFLPTSSHNHVELMAIKKTSPAIKKNLSLTILDNSIARIGILNVIEIDIFLKFYSQTNILVLFMLGYIYKYMYM
jgi:hypothetical protein